MHRAITYIKKHSFLILLVIAASSLGVFKWLKRKPKDQTGNASDILNGAGASENDSIIANKAALDLSHHLGTAYPKWDPRSWTENDNEAFEVLQSLSQSQFELTSLVYHDVYAKGHTLRADLAKLLDDELYKQLTFV